MKYGRWNPAPQLWPWFKNLRERDSSCSLTYEQFATEIGPIPAEMKAPTVGRIDHSKGYVTGNFRWEEKSDNSRECANRVGLTRAGNLASRESVKHNSRQIVVCPHCAKSGKHLPMKRWHFDNCRMAA